MEFIKKYWWLILVIIVLVILIKKQLDKKPQTQTQSNVFTPITNAISENIGSVITSPNSQAEQPKTSGFLINDKIYSKSSANVYKTPLISSSNLDTYKIYSKDEYIGNYLSTDGNFIKITLFNPVRIGYVQSSQIYSK